MSIRTATTGAAVLVLGVSALTVPAATAQPVSGTAAAVAAGTAAHNGRAPQVRWDWTMPTFMVDRKTFVPTDDPADPDWAQGGSYVKGPDTIPDQPMRELPRYRNAGPAVYGELPANERFAVKLDATASTGQGRLRCAWVIRTDPRPTKLRSNCANRPTVQLPEGRHGVMLTVTDGKGRATTVRSAITVKNVLVAVLGDSYGSGEGFPPFTEPTATGTGRQIDWDYPSCNRTRWSGFVRAAQMLESADPRSNVTLVDVACAGGEVDKGYIRTITSTSPPQTAEIPTGGILYPKRRLLVNGTQQPGYEQPQVDQVRAITRGATIDSLLLSIGGNDAGLSDIGIACALEDLAKPNCYNQVPFFWDQKPNARPLYEVIDDNLVALGKRYERMAPCFGAGKGTCRTTKVVKGAPAAKATPTQPLELRQDRSLIHAGYPDLTSTTENGAIVPCTNKPLPQSPMNEIDNSWAFDSVYVGRAGTPYTLPQTYSPPLPAPAPATLTPTGNGIITMIRENAQRYGWTPMTSTFRASRGHGLCAGDKAWEYGLTQAQLLKNPANPSGALHPNDLGQAAYADGLNAAAKRVTGIPVSAPRDRTVHGRG